MVEVARIQTCTMPHGSRLNSAGTKHYSACMMDDMLVEIDTRELAVTRHFMLTKGSEHGMTGAPARRGTAARSSGDTGGHGMDAAQARRRDTCSPTWAQPSADGRRIFVACNKTSEIVEIDVTSWTMTRRIPAGDGVYNLATTRDGTLLVGHEQARPVGVGHRHRVAARSWRACRRTRRVVHGVAISPDDRYAFISVEGVGSEPGTVDVIDLAHAAARRERRRRAAGGRDRRREELSARGSALTSGIVGSKELAAGGNGSSVTSGRRFATTRRPMPATTRTPP